MEVHSLSQEIIQDLAKDATPITADEIHKTFSSNSIDIISHPLGTRILSLSDEFFAEASNLTNPSAPINRPGVYVSTGAWYDGWETRRHNSQPYDFVVFRLGVASGTVKGVEIDTGFFSGNHAPEISVEGCFREDGAADEEVAKQDFNGWETILQKKECGPACRQAWLLSSMSDQGGETKQKAYTHVRLRMYPDGGIGRFRLYGSVVPVLPVDPSTVFDLAATVNGGLATSCSDQHFGVKDNLLLPGRGKDMGDGWETKRTRGEHVDWVVVKLGCPGIVDKILVDTKDFKGNFPKQVQIFGAVGEKEPAGAKDARWVELLSPQACGADREHVFEGRTLQHTQGEVYGWVKMVIIPDGGVKRLRVYGRRRV